MSTESKEARRTNRPVAAWLSNGARLLNRLFSWPLGFENFREDVRRWARLYEYEEEERRKWAPLTSIQDIHDLRHTTATGMAKIGVPPHIVEACLNHVSGAKTTVAGTYNRAAYAPEKHAALERWAAHIERVVSGEPAKKVVGLRAVQK
jgi:Phage integrase family